MSGLYQKRRKRPELNLVPLIDVLVMLIFFAFVTMQFKSAATLNITLPKVETAGKSDFKGTVTIAIDKTGELSFKCHWGNPGRRTRAVNREPGNLPRAVVLWPAGVCGAQRGEPQRRRSWSRRGDS